MEINDIDANSNDDVTSDDCDYEMFANTPKKLMPKQEANGNQMRVKLPSVALVFDHYGLSDLATASITSAVLQDIGLVYEGDVSHVIEAR